MLDFRTETFLSVCRNMNFTKAAQELGITQPAVSQHIKYIEDYYGIKLFEFSGKKMQISEAGRLLMNALITMKHDEIHLREAVLECSGRTRNLNFGLTLTIGEFVLPSFLAQYLKKNTDAEMNVTVANTHELLEKLDSGEIDFAVVEGYFDTSRYDCRIVSKERFIAVSAPGKKLEGEVRRLLSQRLIVREKGSGTREILERYLADNNLNIKSFRSIVEMGNMNAIKELVESDCGITFMYEAAVRRELENSQLSRIDIKDFAVTHDFTFIWRKNSMFSDYYAEIYEGLKENL